MRVRKEEIGPARRRRGTEREVTCEEFEFERVVSCNASGERRRTGLGDLVRSEPLDDGHFAAAVGTKPEFVCGGGGFLGGLWLGC